MVVECTEETFLHSNFDDCEKCSGNHNKVSVVAVHGAYCDSNPKGSRASFGMYWGHMHKYNGARLLEEYVYCKEDAEIMAILCGLRYLENLVKDDDPMDEDSRGTVLIKTDSKYGVEVVSRDIPWKENVWKMGDNTPIPFPNQGMFEYIQATITRLEEAYNCSVFFWYVKQQWNQEAARFAEEALDTAEQVGNLRRRGVP